MKSNSVLFFLGHPVYTVMKNNKLFQWVKHKFTTTRQYEKLKQNFFKFKECMLTCYLKIKMFIKSKSGTIIHNYILLRLMKDKFIHKFRKILIFSDLN